MAWAEAGASRTPPADRPVDAIDMAMERLAPGNQRVTTVVAGTRETPLLPTPNTA